jgi:hypothetical protein
MLDPPLDSTTVTEGFQQAFQLSLLHGLFLLTQSYSPSPFLIEVISYGRKCLLAASFAAQSVLQEGTAAVGLNSTLIT